MARVNYEVWRIKHAQDNYAEDRAKRLDIFGSQEAAENYVRNKAEKRHERAAKKADVDTEINLRQGVWNKSDAQSAKDTDLPLGRDNKILYKGVVEEVTGTTVKVEKHLYSFYIVMTEVSD